MIRLLPLVLACVVACRPETPPEPDKSAPEPAHEHANDDEHEALPTQVKLPESVLRASGVKVAPARFEALAPSLDLTGEVVADPDLTAVLVAQVPGRIVELRFREGDRVKKGAVLALVESAELARARAAVTASAAKATAARRLATRLGELATGGLSSGQERSAAESDAAALEAEAAAARQALAAFGAGALEAGEHPARLALRAPIDGVVLSRAGVLGQVVGADFELARIANLERVYFTARLFEKNLASVVAGRRADVRLNAFADEVFTGTVESIGRQLDPAARTVVARIAIRNRRDLLKIGLFGTARVLVDGQGPGVLRLVVPQGAITRIGDRDVVFVQHADRGFELHRVTLGRASGGLVEVLEGLREGEAVAVDGVFTLKSVILKSTFGEEE